MNATLPLFDGLEPAGTSLPTDESAGTPVRGRRPGIADSMADGAAAGAPAASGFPRSGRPSRGDAGGDQHLRAAWRLSRAMWRFPDHSPQQTRAGLAICHHLQALLAEAEDPPSP